MRNIHGWIPLASGIMPSVKALSHSPLKFQIISLKYQLGVKWGVGPPNGVTVKALAFNFKVSHCGRGLIPWLRQPGSSQESRSGGGDWLSAPGRGREKKLARTRPVYRSLPGWYWNHGQQLSGVPLKITHYLYFLIQEDWWFSWNNEIAKKESHWSMCLC